MSFAPCIGSKIYRRLRSGLVGAARRRGVRRYLRVGSGTSALLRDRNFRPYLIGNMLSGIGTWFQTLGQSILIYHLTGSAFLLGVVGFSSYAAVFLLAPVVGSVSDRYDRRVVLIISQVSATVVTGALCAVTAT